MSYFAPPSPIINSPKRKRVRYDEDKENDPQMLEKYGFGEPPPTPTPKDISICTPEKKKHVNYYC